MTREEAKKQIAILSMYNNSLTSTIDKIYNDFESRTCENCKHYQSDIEICDRNVYERVDGLGDVENKCSKDFGCNKYESR